MLTTKEVADALDLDLRYTRRLITSGKIKATKMTPRLYLVDPADVEAYKQAHPKSKAGRPRTDRQNDPQ